MKGYYLLPSYFTSARVEEMKALVDDDSDGWRLGDIRAEQKTNLEIRNVDLHSLGGLQNRALNDMLSWLGSQINMVYFGYDILGMNQMDMLRYRATDENGLNQHYGWHEDTDWVNPKPTQRKLTMIIQLSDSDDYEGGGLQFAKHKITEGHDFRGKGTVIIFPAPWTHRITPITKGVRRSIVAWVEGPPWR